MSHLIGTDHVDRFTILDAEGDPVLGATFAADQNRGPDGNTFPWGSTELGSGLYEVRWEVDQSGVYYLRLVTQGGIPNPPQVFEFQLTTDDPEIGATVTHYFTILDDDGDYAVGVPVSVSLAIDPNAIAFAPIIEDLGDGLYQATWVGGSLGVYTLRLLADLSVLGDDPQYFEFETRIAPGTIDADSPFSSVVGPSLDEIVRGVAVACRDYYRVRATDDAPDGSTWPDITRLTGRSPKTFKGSSLFVTNAVIDDNIGSEVVVRDSVDGALVLTPSLPGPVRRGDEAYMTNLESAGFARDIYVEEINSRVRAIFPNAVRPAAWTFPDAFNADVPYVTPPEDFTHVYGVSYPSWWGAEATPYFVPHTEYKDGDGWWWDKGHDRLVLNGGYAISASGAALTILGFGRWGALTDPDDVTGVDYEWLVHMAAGMMILSLRDARRQAEAAMHFNRADALRVKVSTPFPPNTIRIR
jgi:hypothetical protein